MIRSATAPTFQKGWQKRYKTRLRWKATKHRPTAVASPNAVPRAVMAELIWWCCACTYLYTGFTCIAPLAEPGCSHVDAEEPQASCATMAHLHVDLARIVTTQ